MDKFSNDGLISRTPVNVTSLPLGSGKKKKTEGAKIISLLIENNKFLRQ